MNEGTIGQSWTVFSGVIRLGWLGISTRIHWSRVERGNHHVPRLRRSSSEQLASPKPVKQGLFSMIGTLW